MRCVVARFALRAFVFEGSSDPHPFDSDRREHCFPDELVVARARDFFDHAAQHAVTKVRVGVAGAGIEIERLSQHVADDVARRGRTGDAQRLRDLSRAKHRVETLVAVPAAGVLKQVPDGDLLPARIQFFLL